jgi:hypothetical protein
MHTWHGTEKAQPPPELEAGCSHSDYGREVEALQEQVRTASVVEYICLRKHGIVLHF